MVVDVRYHLASLVGVFFALGLGILIGTSISSDGRLLKEQTAMIDTIEGQLGQLRLERAGFKADLARAGSDLKAYQAFAGRILPALVANRLSGHAIAFVGLGGDTEPTKALETLFRQAGAAITGMMQVSEPFSDTTDEAVVQWATPVKGKSEWVVVFADTVAVDSLRRVAAALRQDGFSVLVALQGQGTARSLRLPAGVQVVENTGTPLGEFALVEKLAEAVARKAAAGGTRP